MKDMNMRYERIFVAGETSKPGSYVAVGRKYLVHSIEGAEHWLHVSTYYHAGQIEAHPQGGFEAWFHTASDDESTGRFTGYLVKLEAHFLSIEAALNAIEKVYDPKRDNLVAERRQRAA